MKITKLQLRRIIKEELESVLNEIEEGGGLMPYLTGQGPQSRPIDAIKGFEIGGVDLADFVRDWNMEVTNFGAQSNIPSGTSSQELAAAYMKKSPDRAKAYEYLKDTVAMFDEYSAASKAAIEAGKDVGAVNDMYMKKYGKQLMAATKKLPKLFGKRSGDITSGPEGRQKRKAAAAKQSRIYDKGDQDRMRQASKAARDAESGF